MSFSKQHLGVFLYLIRLDRYKTDVFVVFNIDFYGEPNCKFENLRDIVRSKKI